MFYQSFVPPEIKGNPIIDNKHGIYEMPDEFPNDLTLNILEIRKGQENLKTQKSQKYNLVYSLSPKIKLSLH